MRTLRPREDQVGDLPPAEAHPGGELDFHVVGLLENGTEDKSESKTASLYQILFHLR